MNYDQEKYEIWNWKKKYILHWVLNPGLAINELLLGQTVPKIMLEEKESEKPFYERVVIPCPHCETLHSGVKWSGHNKTAFWNWYGLYCDNCSGIIPVIRNWLTLLILFITFPIWGWFRKSLKQSWLDRQPKRFENLKQEFPEKINTYQYWLKAGLGFGLLSFVLTMTLLYFTRDLDFILDYIFMWIIVFLISGIAWGLLMKIFMTKRLEKRI